MNIQHPTFRMLVAVYLATFCLQGMADTPIYTESSRTLELPIVNIGGTYYYGIKARLDNISLLQAPTASGTCDPGNDMSLAAHADFSCFPTQPAYDEALVGVWSSVSGYSGNITLTFPPTLAYGSGTFSVYTVAETSTSPAAVYHNPKNLS